MFTLVSISTCMSYPPNLLSPCLRFHVVDYNEDFSALHALTLLKQTDYAQAAIQYILSQYPPGTSIILIGHSMGGIVATALLARQEFKAPIRAVFTMSTPALLAPVRFDRRTEDVYTSIRNAQLGHLQSDQAQIPLVAICGGATDPQVGSEACAVSFNKIPYRRTVYTTSAEGVWTGVDHLAMVWCDQVRSLVARTALELANMPSQNTITILQKWLKVDVTQVKHDPHLVDLTSIKPVYVPVDGRLRVSEPSAGLHLLAVPPPSEELASGTHHFTLFVSKGNVYNHRSENLPSDAFKVKVLSCDAPPPSATLPPCRTLGGEVKLIPNPPRNALFPAKGGVLETEGVLVFEASVPASTKEKWVGVLVEEGVHRKGWIVAGFDSEEPALLPVAKTGMMAISSPYFNPHAVSRYTWFRSANDTAPLAPSIAYKNPNTPCPFKCTGCLSIERSNGG
jgi:glycosylphosphatidylinositol deacylase